MSVLHIRGRVFALLALLCAAAAPAAADPPQTDAEQWRVGVLYTTIDPATGVALQTWCEAIPASPTLIVVMDDCRVTWAPRLTFVRPRGAPRWTLVKHEHTYTAEQTGACPMAILELQNPLPADHPLESWRNACADPADEGEKA